MNEILCLISKGDFKMKYFLLFSLVFFAFNGFSNEEDEYGLISFENGVQYKFEVANRFWLDIMGNDLNKRLKDEIISSNGGENVDIENLRPQRSFTKPHRVQLMSRFVSGPVIQRKMWALWDDQGRSGRVKIWDFNSYRNKYVGVKPKVRFVIGEVSSLNESFFLSLELLNECVINGGVEFSLSNPFRENGRIIEHSLTSEECVFDSLLYPIAEEYVRLTDEFRERNSSSLDPENYTYVLTPEDRWWWNENIKPLLEDMLMLWDLYHGDYESY